jgi:hypothetical protein
MRYLTVPEVLALYERVMEQSAALLASEISARLSPLLHNPA